MNLRSTNGLLLSPPPQQPALVENKINPNIFLIIVVVAIIFFISGLLHLLIRCLLRPTTGVRAPEDADVAVGATALQGQLQQLFHLHDAGVDQSFIDALPAFFYKAIIGAINDPFDCAVCLCEFEPEHKLRLLPKCSHAFHAECIDTWLLAHSTCPLCRGPLLPADFSPGPRRSPILLLESDSADDNDDVSETSVAVTETEVTETKVVQVKLGKFRSVEGSSSDDSSNKFDQRRCFSMGTYEYVMNDDNLLRVAIKPSKKKPVGSRRYAASECNCHSRRISSSSKRESFSASRRAFSFRLSALRCEPKAKPAVGPGMDLDVEVGSMGSQVEAVPSFARRTLLWIVGRHNRVGSIS